MYDHFAVSIPLSTALKFYLNLTPIICQIHGYDLESAQSQPTV